MTFLASSILLSGANGYTVAITGFSSLSDMTWPCASTMAIFTPWRIPGSTPKITLGPAGADISKCCKLLANTSIASASAARRFSVNKRCSICGRHLSFHKLLAASAKNSRRAAGALASTSKWLIIFSINGASSPSIFRPKTFSWRPRNIANRRWFGSRARLSLCSK